MFTRKPFPTRRLSLWVLCLFGAYNVFQCCAQDSLCSPGTYANSTEPPVECLPCHTCEQGQGIAAACGGTNNTVCENCMEDHYSKLTPTGRKCLECESCGSGRSEVSPCMSSQNTICGSCALGYFLYIDDRGSECKRCSKCPIDHIVVHWIECAEAGRPVNEQCAPGEWSEVSTSYSATPLPSSPMTQAANAGRTRLPLSHGTFVPMTNYEQPGSSPPSQDKSTRNIAIVSIAFTCATFIVFVIASGTMCAHEYRKYKRSNPKSEGTSTTTRTSSPIAESDEIAETAASNLITNISQPESES